MLHPKKQKAIAMAHSRARGMQTPYLRLCANIMVSHPYTWDEVSKIARESDHTGVYRIGHFADFLEPYVKGRLSDVRFPYSFVEVDGLKRNSAVNVGFWQSKPDVLSVSPQDYEKVFEDISLVEVFSGMVDMERFRGELQPGEAEILRLLQEKLGRGKLPLLKPSFQMTFGPSTEPNGPYRYKGYMFADPAVLEFYGGDPAPPWYRDMIKRAREIKKVRIGMANGELKIL